MAARTAPVQMGLTAVVPTTRSRDPLVIGDPHLRATADGLVIVRVRGDGPAAVTIRAAGPLSWRRLGERRLSLRPTGTTTVAFQLSDDHLAWLRRRQTTRMTITVTTA